MILLLLEPVRQKYGLVFVVIDAPEFHNAFVKQMTYAVAIDKP